MAVDTLFLRVDSDLKVWLEEYVKGLKKEGRSVTQSAIVERALSYFQRLTPQEQLDILEGRDNRLGGMGRLVYGLGWGDHAFNKKRWAWALEEYNSLNDFAETSPEFKGLLRHKQGYCCLDIGITLRKEALLPPKMRRKNKEKKGSNATPGHSALWDRTYAAADTALALALTYHQDFPGYHPVATFNTACCWSLRAQYAVERELGPGSEWITQLRTVIGTPSASSDAETECWKDIGKQWRAETGAKPTSVKEIQRYAQQSLNALQQLDEPRKNALPPTDTTFLLRLAGEDPDLMFLRCDADAHEKFEPWYEKADNEERMLSSFEGIVERLPPPFRAKLKTI